MGNVIFDNRVINDLVEKKKNENLSKEEEKIQKEKVNKHLI